MGSSVKCLGGWVRLILDRGRLYFVFERLVVIVFKIIVKWLLVEEVKLLEIEKWKTRDCRLWKFIKVIFFKVFCMLLMLIIYN